MPATYMDRQMRAGEARVLVPSDWENLSEKHKCALASRLVSGVIITPENAHETIRAYLAQEG